MILIALTNLASLIKHIEALLNNTRGGKTHIFLTPAASNYQTCKNYQDQLNHLHVGSRAPTHKHICIIFRELDFLLREMKALMKKKKKYINKSQAINAAFQTEEMVE